MATAGTQCFAFGCKNYRNSHSKARRISFHRFPDKNKHPDGYAKWLKNCHRRDEPSRYSILCSKHFSEEALDKTGQIVRVRDDGVPTIFNLPDHLQPSQPKVRGTNNSMSCLDVPDELALEITDQPSAATGNKDVHDHAYAGSPVRWKRKYLEYGEQLETVTKRLKNAQRREKRAKATCKVLVSQLYEQNLINAELRTKLESFGDIPWELFDRHAHSYSDQQKDFALTLHLQSPKAYAYLRSSIGLPLPHPRTLRKWMESVDATPGLNLAMLDVLSAKKEQNPEEYTRCCLMIDAMSIRQHVDYNRHNGGCSGYVDLGYGVDETTEAKEALVFMLVGLIGSWKSPVAFYFTKGLSAETQKELVSHCLDKLHERKFDVTALTMDGHPSNVAMCTLLGAELNVAGNMRTYITSTTGQRTYVTFDACHMLKLTRNMLQCYNTIRSSEGTISWNYIRDLHNAQEDAGLRLANRLTSKHILFQQQKMKVSLAVQVLSSSVSNALRTMLAIGDPRFTGCEATANFIARIDRLFDVLNSRSPRAKGYKSPITAHNILGITQFLSETRAYLIDLTMIDGQPLYRTKRCMCIKGFVVLIDSVLSIAGEVLQQQKYLLTYKLSQDHLELFFNAIRRCGGWNNNPTAQAFQGTFRKIITHCGAIQVSKNGNCLPQDSTELVQATTASYVPPDAQPMEEEENDPFEAEEVVAQDHSYDTRSLSPLIENAVVYISGWVVRKVMPTLSCDECRSGLVATATNLSTCMYQHACHLLRLKQNGGLVIPSKGCIDVILCAEKHLRRMTDTHRFQPSFTELRLQSKVVAELGGKQLFNDDHTYSTQDGIDNHNLSLIRLLVGAFYTLRQHHIIRLQNLKRCGRNVRHKLTKTILFKGQ